MKYIIGNWKSNKNQNEVSSWFDQFNNLYSQNKNIDLNNLEIVLLAPFIYLPQVKSLVSQYNLPLKIGAQNLSPFQMGAYTGEVNSFQLADFCDYVLIGHSERRKYFHEDNDILMKKVIEAEKAHLKTIYCVGDAKTNIPDTISIVAYEPVWAIGTGTAETPDKAQEVARIIKEKQSVKTVIYGGSVSPSNIALYLGQEDIDGVLPGGASLDPSIFWQLVTNVHS